MEASADKHNGVFQIGKGAGGIKKNEHTYVWSLHECRPCNHESKFENSPGCAFCSLLFRYIVFICNLFNTGLLFLFCFSEVMNLDK
uniref:Uncharacterized protein n=1 Tax=Anguilla anguilla TaxID=7936 RepID=A0A0E9WMD8_ANGAN